MPGSAPLQLGVVLVSTLFLCLCTNQIIAGIYLTSFLISYLLPTLPACLPTTHTNATHFPRTVQLRESALSAAEMEIQKLASTTEAKVDKSVYFSLVILCLSCMFVYIKYIKLCCIYFFVNKCGGSLFKCEYYSLEYQNNIGNQPVCYGSNSGLYILSF